MSNKNGRRFNHLHLEKFMNDLDSKYSSYHTEMERTDTCFSLKLIKVLK